MTFIIRSDWRYKIKLMKPSWLVQTLKGREHRHTVGRHVSYHNFIVTVILTLQLPLESSHLIYHRATQTVAIIAPFSWSHHVITLSEWVHTHNCKTVKAPLNRP